MAAIVFKDSKIIVECSVIPSIDSIPIGSYIRSETMGINWYRYTAYRQLMPINKSDVPAPIKALCMLMELEV